MSPPLLGIELPYRCLFTSLALSVLAGGCEPAEDGAATPPESPSSSPESPWPGSVKRRELGPAQGVAAADLDGDGVDEWILVQEGRATWGGAKSGSPTGRRDLGGALHCATRGDSDGDGQEEAWIGTGTSRDFREAPARVWRFDRDGAHKVWEREGGRAQVAEIRILDRGVWLVAWDRDKRVDAGWLDLQDSSVGAWEPVGAWEVVASGNLAATQVPLSGSERIVGRVYGDAPRSDGDLVLHSESGKRELPSFRGVRDLLLTDLDEDGDGDLLVSDGWHYAYGTRAVARIALLEGPDWNRARTVAFFPREYTIQEMTRIGRGRDARILATGNRYVYLVERDDLGWYARRAAPVPETGNAVPWRGERGWGVLVSGEPARIHALAGSPQPGAETG